MQEEKKEGTKEYNTISVTCSFINVFFFFNEIRIIRVVNKNTMYKSSPGKQGILYSTFVQTENMVIWTKVYELHTLRASYRNARFDTLYSHSN